MGYYQQPPSTGLVPSFSSNQVYPTQYTDEKNSKSTAISMDNNQALLKKTVQNVELVDGHLSIDVPVPEEVVQMSRYTDDKEFTHTRYTACTVDPDSFADSGYTLRQHQIRREVEIFIVVTM